jgi:hypothetical protein
MTYLWGISLIFPILDDELRARIQEFKQKNKGIVPKDDNGDDKMDMDAMD